MFVLLSSLANALKCRLRISMVLLMPVFSWSAFGQSEKSDLNNELVASDLAVTEFVVTPKLCLQNGEQKLCQLSVTLHWKIAQSAAICIRTDHADIANWCGQSNEYGQHTLTVSTAKSIVFSLYQQASDVVLAQTELTLARVKQVNKRRRFRQPWSLF